MKIRKLFAILMVCLLITGIFAGCGAEAMMDAPMDSNAGMDYFLEESMDAPESPEYSLNDSSSAADSASGETAIDTQNQKLIRTVYMDAETEDMDALLSQVQARINELGGYVEAREVYNGSMYNSTRYRNANLTVRIPADKLNAFVDHVSQVSNITSSQETVDDVTLQYVAIESRIKALETEQQTLLDLMAKAETMSDLLTIESRLTEVRYELENINSQLRVYDNKINYATIHLDISEVVEYTEPEPENGWQRMGKGFVKSVKGVGNGLKEFFIWLVAAIPYLLLIGVIGLGIFLIIWGSIRRGRKKRAAKKAAE